MEWYWQGKTEVLGEKPVPVPLGLKKTQNIFPFSHWSISKHSTNLRKATEAVMLAPAQTGPGAYPAP